MTPYEGRCFPGRRSRWTLTLRADARLRHVQKASAEPGTDAAWSCPSGDDQVGSR